MSPFWNARSPASLTTLRARGPLQPAIARMRARSVALAVSLIGSAPCGRGRGGAAAVGAHRIGIGTMRGRSPLGSVVGAAVLLHHRLADGSSHYDWMIERLAPSGRDPAALGGTEGLSRSPRLVTFRGSER